MTNWSARLWNVVSLRRAVAVVGLTLAWCALWGEVTTANVLSGIVVSVVGLRFGVQHNGRGGVRLWPLLQFAGLVAVDLVRSTLAVIREVATPEDHTEEGIIAVPVPVEGRRHLLLVYVAITVTPGTAVVAGEADSSVVYVHVLYRAQQEDVRAHTIRLAELAGRALPLPPGDNRTDGGTVAREDSR